MQCRAEGVRSLTRTLRSEGQCRRLFPGRQHSPCEANTDGLPRNASPRHSQSFIFHQLIRQTKHRHLGSRRKKRYSEPNLGETPRFFGVFSFSKTTRSSTELGARSVVGPLIGRRLGVGEDGPQVLPERPGMLLVLAEQPSGIPHPHSSGRVPSQA